MRSCPLCIYSSYTLRRSRRWEEQSKSTGTDVALIELTVHGERENKQLAKIIRNMWASGDSLSEGKLREEGGSLRCACVSTRVSVFPESVSIFDFFKVLTGESSRARPPSKDEPHLRGAFKVPVTLSPPPASLALSSDLSASRPGLFTPKDLYK